MDLANAEACTGCCACVHTCKNGCISLARDAEGFVVPVIDATTCIDCGACTRACPVLNTEGYENLDTIPRVYVGHTSDDDMRFSSSSGGVFGLLARKVLDGGGVVFGAAYSTDCYEVAQIAITRREEAHLLYGSKYVESTMVGAYRTINELIAQDRTVLYCGTPCQVAAIRRACAKHSDHLILVDLLCHGVPSQKAWASYMRYWENRHGAKVIGVNMRDKRTGWRSFSLSLSFDDGSTISRQFDDDLYGQVFIRNAALRRCCYKCPFSKIDRASSLTLGDAWGVDEGRHPSLFDNLGTSLVYVHDEIGEKLLESVVDDWVAQELTGDEKRRSLSALQGNAVPHARRAEFYTDMDSLPFDILVKRYAPPTLRNRVGYFLRHSQVFKRCSGKK